MAIAEIIAAPEVTPSGRRSRMPWERGKPIVFALIVPLLLLAFWQVATTQQWTRLIPTPYQVGEYMVDFAVGGIYDDAYSGTLVTHLLASMSRVYGGFALAALFALPIGLMIGRMPVARMLLDPFLQVMRPIPVTAWLPLSMILFGLGARSAFALVCLGAFYPILLNTIFGVRAVDPKLFEAAAMLGCRAMPSSTRSCCRPPFRRSSPACGSALAWHGSSSSSAR
jgi:NitT/TauT family transport system permease protein